MWTSAKAFAKEPCSRVFDILLYHHSDCTELVPEHPVFGVQIVVLWKN